MAALKIRLLAEGLRLMDGAAAGAKPALRVRSGSCGGLDLVLPDGTWVNAPVHEKFARTSSMVLNHGEDGPVLVVDGERHPVRLVAEPDFYRRSTEAGTPMRRVGQLCSDRLGIGLTNACTFYRSRETRCRFCSIGLNTGTEQGNKADDDALEVTLAAGTDAVAPARHILLGGGTPDPYDTGAHRIAELAATIKARCDVPIYAMLAPPGNLEDLDRLADAGVDEVGMNIEVFTEEAARRYLPGKHAAIPHEHYWRALTRAVELFGPVNTRSIAIVGLEPPQESIAGAERLASMGVLPILTPLRPLAGTPLEDHPRLPWRMLWNTAQAADAAARVHGLPLGPVCIPCQANCLTVPGHALHRHY